MAAMARSPLPRATQRSRGTAAMAVVALLAVTVVAALLPASDAMCVMTQKCVNPGNVPDFEDCMPEANPVPVAPQPMRGAGWANVTGGGACTSDDDCHGKGSCSNKKCVCHDDGMSAGAHCDEFLIQCPEYKDAACCTWQQNQGMAENFKLLSTVFGTVSGGCDACAANLMHLWCGLVCSPRQAEFMRMHSAYPSTNRRYDPMTDVDNVKVLELDVTLGKPYTCSLFDSCKNTGIASITEALKSSLGFLNYQAQTGAIGHGEYMFLHFNGTSNATAFAHHVHKCDNYSEVATSPAARAALPTQAKLLPSIASDSAPKQCPCGACRATCDAHAGASNATIHVVENPISVWDGFNAKLVGVVYAVVVAAVVALYFQKTD